LASLIRQFATRLTAKEEFRKRKLWKNLKLSAFVVGAAPWLIPDPACIDKAELTDSEVQRCHILYMVKTYTSFARERKLHKSRYYVNAVLEVFLIFLAPCWRGFNYIIGGAGKHYATVGMRHLHIIDRS